MCLAADTLEDLVQEFIRVWRPILGPKAERYRTMPSLSQAITEAALSRREDGKRESHQCRIPRRVLELLRGGLDEGEVRRCQSFDELHAYIEAICGRIPGAGRLLVYDVAQRIGAHLGLEPERVYLHQGTREGAKALGLGQGKASLERHDLPPELSALTCSEVEDFLCICKGALAALQLGYSGS